MTHRAGPSVSMREDEARQSQIARAPRIATAIMELVCAGLQNFLSITIEQSIETQRLNYFYAFKLFRVPQSLSSFKVGKAPIPTAHISRFECQSARQ